MIAANWHYTIYVELPSLSLGLLSRPRVFMNKSISKSGVLIISYGSLAKPELWNVVKDNNVMVEIRAQLSVSLLQSSSVHLNPHTHSIVSQP